MRKVVLKLVSSASPRTSGPPVFEDSSMARYFSRWVWRQKVPGLLGMAMIRKRSSGEMAEYLRRLAEETAGAEDQQK